MKYARILAASLLAAALFAVGGISTANAQGDLLTPPTVRDGSASGEVVVSWPAISGAKFYRIGWVARQDLDVVTSAGRDWKDAFVFMDVANLGQTSYTVPRLEPGGLHHFIMGSVDERFGSARWSDWATLTLAGGVPVCPAAPQPEPEPAPTGSAAGDREALIAFYHSTNGENWINDEGWLSDNPFHRWNGVNSRHDRATGLFMRKNGISGQLPRELGNLTEFDLLDLAFNQITGIIPAELGNLSKLQSIYLFDNQFSGPIPPSLGNLSQLQVLHLYNNRLSGQVPESLGDLANLRVLHLRDNNLTGSLPASLGNLHNLEWMHIQGNNFSGCIPAGLQDVPNNDFDRLGMEFCGQ